MIFTPKECICSFLKFSIYFYIKRIITHIKHDLYSTKITNHITQENEGLNQDCGTYFWKAYLLHQLDGSYMLVLSPSPRLLWCPGEHSLVSLQHEILCETREYSPEHQRHLGEANKTNVQEPPFWRSNYAFNFICNHCIGPFLIPCTIILNLGLNPNRDTDVFLWPPLFCIKGIRPWIETVLTRLLWQV